MAPRPQSAANSQLIATNAAWLRQGLSLVQQLDDASFRSSPPGLAPHRVGSHLRHVLEFYECFLDGLDSLNVDYDARRRDESLSTSRQAAIQKIIGILQRFEDDVELRRDSVIFVRMENADPSTVQDPYLCSSVNRELQALSSHTIHHFALIAITLRVHGFAVDPEFGMSPSTLRFHANRELAASAEAA